MDKNNNFLLISDSSEECISDSSRASSNSPPQLSPQNSTQLSPQNPIYVDLQPSHNDHKDSALLMIGSPQMALLTPQMKENQMVQEIPTTKYPSITVKVMSCESKSVPFTFCNMKSNIFDLKKKRGRKRKMISCNYDENTEGKIHSISQKGSLQM